MIVFICFAAIALARPQAIGQESQQSSPHPLFQRIPHEPSIRNGYDNYLVAAELVQDAAFNNYAYWTADKYTEVLDTYNRTALDQRKPLEADLAEAKRLHDLGYLGVQREFMGRYAHAMEEVMAGNKKETWDPRKEIGTETVFPEFMYFKMLSRLFVAAAYVSFASGEASKGAHYLHEDLVFSRKMAANTVIGNLVAWAVRAITLTGYETHSDRISLEDWDEVVKFCDENLATDDNLSSVIALEKKWIDRDVSKGTGLGMILTAGGYPKASKAFEALPRQDQVRLAGDLRLNMDRYYESAIQRFQKPESEWYGSQDPARGDMADQPNPTFDQLLQLLVEAHTMDTDSIAGAGGKMRTQLRILRLHALVHKYWWSTGRLPPKLTDAAAAEDMRDPFSGKTFKYAVTANNRYRLYSEGRPELGQVDLVYHRPADSRPAVKPPPE